SVYRIEADTLKELAPTLIVTQSQCEVCAVSFDEVNRVVCDFLDLPAEIVSLEPNGLDDVFADIQRVANALGVPERGTGLVTEMQSRMNRITAQAASLENKPTVALIEWIDPPMAAGNWMPNLVEMAGGINLFGEPGKHSPWLAWDDLLAANPDVIVLLPCGYNIAKTQEEMAALTSREGWSQLTAVQQGRVYITDGNQYFNRPGPRLVESVEILAEILHPDVFNFEYEGTGWVRSE
ncbi:MAG: ABC transporter substrate-binding protein, partial [Chloroflexota bacterium]